jgi:predicted enzyme related to lactoylglutathione lyase
MTIAPVAVTVDCGDALTVATFWAAALDRSVDPDGSDEFASIGFAGADQAQAAWMFMRVPEGKSAKNRMHLDFGATDREGEVRRLVALGATRLADVTEAGNTWTVLQDPEGNEFCVAQAPGKES